MSHKWLWKTLVWLMVFLSVTAGAAALEPEEILVLANRNAKDSVGLAKYYMAKRGIPKKNLLKLFVADKEVCLREDYEKLVRIKVLAHLKKKDPGHKIRCLVTMYGMPLKIKPPELSLSEKMELEVVRQRRKQLYEKLKTLKDVPLAEKKQVEAGLATIKKNHDVLKKDDQRASLDSELALVKVANYDLSGWIPNPWFVGFRARKLPISENELLWVSRLDGPSPDIVRRVIDDSIAVEKSGLVGRAYFDARWRKPSAAKKVSGYGLYDKSIHWAAKRLGDKNWMPVVVDDKEALFQPGQCPDAALYCGWYSLSRYVDAFDWVKGAVGYHIASGECATLKRDSSQAWCKRMLEDGVVATVGPTSEPYVNAFPLPELFFSLLADGQMSLAGCYMASLPYVSWQMVLVGDPLYRPFKTTAGTSQYEK